MQQRGAATVFACLFQAILLSDQELEVFGIEGKFVAVSVLECKTVDVALAQMARIVVLPWVSVTGAPGGCCLRWAASLSMVGLIGR